MSEPICPECKSDRTKVYLQEKPPRMVCYSCGGTFYQAVEAFKEEELERVPVAIRTVAVTPSESWGTPVLHERNPERDQDRVEDLCKLFYDRQEVMFPQQRRIYEQLALWVSGMSVLEAGCGNGVGSAMLQREVAHFVATDKSEWNLTFARELYPWIDFQRWDIQEPLPMLRPEQSNKFQAVVCVECLEHVADPRAALRNLIAAARKEVWISTPNGKGRRRPPENEFHVLEYTVPEMMEMIFHHPRHPPRSVAVFGWENFEPVPTDTDVNPLVYRVTL